MHLLYFFCACALWCKKAQHAWGAWQNEWRRHFISLVVRASDDSLSTNQPSAVSLAPPFRYLNTVLVTPTEGYQKIYMVRFTFLVSFTISDNGNGSNCILYCTETYRSVEMRNNAHITCQTFGLIIIFHPKMKMLSFFHTLRNCTSFFPQLNTNVLKNVGDQTVKPLFFFLIKHFGQIMSMFTVVAWLHYRSKGITLT